MSKNLIISYLAIFILFPFVGVGLGKAIGSEKLNKIIKVLIYAILSLFSLYFLANMPHGAISEVIFFTRFFGTFNLSFSHLDIYSIILYSLYVLFEEVLSKRELKESLLPMLPVFVVLVLFNDLILKLWFLEFAFLFFYRTSKNNFDLLDYLSTASLAAFTLFNLLGVDSSPMGISPVSFCLVTFGVVKIIGLSKVKMDENKFLYLIFLTNALFGVVSIESAPYLFAGVGFAVAALFLSFATLETTIASIVLLVINFSSHVETTYLSIMFMLFACLLGMRHFSNGKDRIDRAINRFYWLALMGIPIGGGVIFQNQLSSNLNHFSPELLFVLGLAGFVFFSSAIKALEKNESDCEGVSPGTTQLVLKAIFAPVLFLIYNWII